MGSKTCPDCKGPKYKYANFCNRCKSKGVRNGRYGKPMTRRSKRLVPMTTTRCIHCDEWFDRPKDDPSCRRCKTCRRNQQYVKPVQEGWETIAC